MVVTVRVDVAGLVGVEGLVFALEGVTTVRVMVVVLEALPVSLEVLAGLTGVGLTVGFAGVAGVEGVAGVSEEVRLLGLFACVELLETVDTGVFVMSVRIEVGEGATLPPLPPALPRPVGPLAILS